MSGVRIAQVVLLGLVACSPAQSGSQDASVAGAISARDWHADKRRVDAAVDAALEGTGGAHYPKAIAILRASGRPPDVIDLEVGQLVTAAYRDTQVARMPVETLDQGIVLLERAATGTGASAGIAPQWLRLLFERGLAKGDRTMLAPNAGLAGCWRDVEKTHNRTAAGSCVAMRHKGGA